MAFSEDQMELCKDDLIERLTLMHLDITQINFEDPDLLANAYITNRADDFRTRPNCWCDLARAQSDLCMEEC
jgi:hypothetical protein